MGLSSPLPCRLVVVGPTPLDCGGWGAQFSFFHLPTPVFYHSFSLLPSRAYSSSGSSRHPGPNAMNGIGRGFALHGVESEHEDDAGRLVLVDTSNEVRASIHVAYLRNSIGYRSERGPRGDLSRRHSKRQRSYNLKEHHALRRSKNVFLIPQNPS
ncbi:hypothetical protein G7K_1459-t1 [Saitoella complicata NRRL Y-17804]|uniref:Uncharacterized protein n=1 Tax=Saitoella complicata (strain BCRC 22490 / CBS 7301 / JCM 7358 / NBRC 10748 / NRRL Y-17804) TaxID=698492 RepID=A0A0E9NBN3_SAICN|nr:hypothetical protein G7K_1459-t1 [Saitoella complicata NRRL Y-17804]